MDYQDAPDVIFDKKWRKTQVIIKKILKNNDTHVLRLVKKLKKKGYSDKEIDDYFSY
jgi:hypothetical protein